MEEGCEIYEEVMPWGNFNHTKTEKAIAQN